MSIPSGLGIGANIETYANQWAAHAQAISVLGAQWSHSWVRPWDGTAASGTPYEFGPNYVPMLDMAYCGVTPAAKLAAWRDRMIAKGLPWDDLWWQFFNEPENSGVSERELARLVILQLVEFDAADILIHIVTPNNNINTLASFNFGVRAFQRIRRASALIAPSCHLWCKAPYVPAVWARYRNWIENYGDKLDPITITEAGPGPMCSMQEWLEFMPLAYDLLDDPRVGALAPFSAYPKLRDGEERHPGFMLADGTLTALGVQYMVARSRLT